jgi:nitrogen fixation/metabolism regulation signal transduction histidine kinase
MAWSAGYDHHRLDVRLLVLFSIVGVIGLAVIALFSWLVRAALWFVLSGEWEGHTREFMDEVAPQVRLSTMIAQRFQAQMIAREIEKKLRRDV